MTIRTLIGEAGIGKIFRDLMFPGVAGVAVAICIGFFEVLKANPGAAAELLKAWGPGFLLGILAIAVVASFLGQMVEAQKESVEAQRQVAVALTSVAQKDDRERDRMATEMGYVARRMDRTLAIVEGIAKQQAEQVKQLSTHSRQLERIEARASDVGVNRGAGGAR